ncbi:MAG TPA: tetraacyldisaccharide 4'-kinase [Microvirga sp.]|jgi:tetraacyldisaccharide 4'-kinase|nr:tetraacyldisaccharide 4'-kinase [Microvirga sp.]
MRAPAFWWRPAPSGLARALGPAAALYGAIAGRRMGRAGAPAPVPVICIGNFTAGGAGKTPTAIRVAEALAARGLRPAFLSRGYGGRLAGPVAVDPARHGADAVGDEPLLLARTAPTIVARDRPAGAALAARDGADAVVMDDGLQNPSLAKDCAIAVVDGAVGIGNGRALPAGPLRAPMAAQWPRVDAVLVIGAGAPGERVAAEAARRGVPVLRGRLAPDGAAAAALAGERVLAFAGIGRPEKFFDTLRACGAEPVVARAFPDHHPYRADEIAALAAQARAGGLRLVTTEKDGARLAGLGLPLAGVTLLPVRLVLEDEAGLAALLDRALARGRARD